MKKKLQMIMAIAVISVSALVGCGNQQKMNTPEGEPSPTDSVEATTVPTSTEEPASTLTNTPTPIPTATPTNTPTPSLTNTPTPTPTPHIHSYAEEVTTEATCETDGVKAYTCACGDTYTETLKAFGHNYEAITDSEVAATCEKDGKSADTKCSACGVQITGEVIPATGHSFSSYVYNNDATYTEDGTKSATCTLCNDKKTVTAEGTKLTYSYTDMNATKFAKSNVNVRALPGTDGEKVGSLATGDTVTVTGKCNETGWYRIKFGDSIGYVSNNYLVDENPVKPTETPTKPDGNSGEKGPNFNGGIEYPLKSKTVYAEENLTVWDVNGNPIGTIMKDESTTLIGVINFENPKKSYDIIEYNGQKAYTITAKLTGKIPGGDPSGYEFGTEGWHKYWDGKTMGDYFKATGFVTVITERLTKEGKYQTYGIPEWYIIGSYSSITYDDGTVIDWKY